MLSSCSTPLHADTFFGHICWALRYMEGEDTLKTFLDSYTLKTQPLLISNAFNKGLIPRPKLLPLKIKEIEDLELIFKEKYSAIEIENALKILKKQEYISFETFNNHRENYSEFEIYTKIFNNELCPINFSSNKPKDDDKGPPPDESKSCCSSKKDDKVCSKIGTPCSKLFPKSEKKCTLKATETTVVTLHNTINRLNGQVLEEGGFYPQDETFFDKDHCEFDLYISIDEEKVKEDKLKKILEFIGENGFGKDKNIGKGHFKLVSLNEIKDFPEPKDEKDKDGKEDYLLALSHFVPDASDSPTDAYYSLITKYGKLGGHYATSADKVPFKKPIIFLKEGSLIKYSKDKDRKFVGCLLDKVNNDTFIRHYAYALCYPIRLKKEEGTA